MSQITKTFYKKNNNVSNRNVNTQNNIIKNNIINSGNTFVLVGCGKEDIMKFDKQKIAKAVSAGFNSTYKLTDLVHFDPDHPEYRWTKSKILSIDFMKRCFIKP